MTRNILYCGDNLEILATIEKESVDIIYIDPPFFSNKNYEIICEGSVTKKSPFLAVFF